MFLKTWKTTTKKLYFSVEQVENVIKYNLLFYYSNATEYECPKICCYIREIFLYNFRMEDGKTIENIIKKACKQEECLCYF